MKKAEEQKTCSSAKLLLTAISLWRTLRQNRKGLCKTYLAGAEGLEPSARGFGGDGKGSKTG